MCPQLLRQSLNLGLWKLEWISAARGRLRERRLWRQGKALWWEWVRDCEGNLKVKWCYEELWEPTSFLIGTQPGRMWSHTMQSLFKTLCPLSPSTYLSCSLWPMQSWSFYWGPLSWISRCNPQGNSLAINWIWRETNELSIANIWGRGTSKRSKERG